MIKNILLVLSVLLFSAVPFSSSAQTCSLDQFGGSSGDRVFTCSPDNATYSITFPLFPSRGTTIQYASLGTVSGNIISGIPAGQAVQVTMANPGCSNTVTRWMRWCCPTPVTSCPPERIWRAIGSPANNGSASYYDMMFENQVTGEIRHAFCTEIDMGGPGVGSRYCLAADDLTLNPISSCTQQIMYIFGSKCDYEKPVMDGIPSTCSSNSNSLTASCAQGTPMWYKKDAIGLTFLGSGNNAPSGFSSLRNYVRCENNEATCFSEYVTVNISNNSDATPIPVPSKTEVCVGETVNLSLEEGCDSHAGFFDEWYQGSTLLTSPIVYPTTTTTYTLRCINTRGCDVTDTPANVTITVNPSCTAPCDVVPNPTIANAERCGNGEVTLTASGCSGEYGYEWSTGQNSASITVNYTGTETYAVRCIETARPSACRSEEVLATITVNTAPVITLGTPMCPADTPNYSVNFTVTAEAVVTSSVGTITGVLGSRSLRGIPPGTEVTIQATIGNCTVTQVFTTPSAPCFCIGAKSDGISGEIEVCYGDTIQIPGTAWSNDYFEFKIFHLGVEVQPGSSFIVTESTSFYSQGASRGPECESGDLARYGVTMKPRPSIEVLDGSVVCDVDGTYFSATFTIPAGATIVSDEGLVDDNIVSNIPSGSTATVTVRTADGCEATTTVTETCPEPCDPPSLKDGLPVRICLGGTATLTAPDCGNGFSYIWSTGETSRSIILSPDSVAMYLYTVSCVSNTNPDCRSNSSKYSLSVNPAPTIIVGTPTCAAGTPTYSIPFTVTPEAVVTSSVGNITDVIGGKMLTRIPPGTEVIITATIGNCSVEEVFTTPSAPCSCIGQKPDSYPDRTFCYGDTITLPFSQGNDGYFALKWFNTLGQEILPTDVLIATANTSFTHRFASIVNECLDGDNGLMQVFVNPLPTITEGTPLCSPNNQSYSVEFTIPTGAILLTTTAGTISGNSVIGIPSGTSATVTVRSTDGCENTATVTHTCTPCITPMGVDGNREICEGETVDLMTFTDPDNGLESDWFSGGVRLTNTVVTPTEETTYVHYYIPKEGCISGEKGMVTVRLASIPTITAGTPMCSADDQSYSVEFTIPAGATLTSTTEGTISGTTVSEIPSGTSATVTVRGIDGCENTATVTHTCITCIAPNPTVSQDISICSGTSTTLTAEGCTTGFTYLWSTGATTETISVSPVNTAQYTVACVNTTDADCKSEVPAEVEVTVLTLPILTLGSPVCTQDSPLYSVTFTVTPGAIVSTSAGTISGNSIIDIPSGTTVVVEATTGTCSVQASTSSRCFCIGAKGHTGEYSICNGESIDLQSLGGCNPQWNSKWTTNGGALLTNTVVSPTTDTNYRHFCVREGCEDGDAGLVRITVNPLPTITVDEYTCAPDGQTYSVIFTIPTGATIATTSGTVNGNVVSGISSGVTATITVTSAEGCTNTTTVIQNCTVPVFDLALRKVLANGAKNPTVTPGSTVTFKIEVWNQGNVDAQNVAVIDYIPNGLTLVADANWTAGTEVATLTTPIATLPAGDSTSVNISFTVDAGFNGSIRNFAEISDADNTAGLEDIDSTPDSNPGNDGTSKDDNISEDHKANPNDDEDDHDYEEINVSPTPVFDLALRKVLANGAKNPTVTPGSTVTFKIEVWNQGNVDAQNIAVIDYIPNGLTLVADANWTAGTEVATLTTPIAALPAGDSTSLNISFTVDADFSGSIRNFAEISDADNTAGLEDIDSTPDSNPGNDGTSKDDNISEDHKANPNDDEDDHDYEEINVSPTPVFDLALRKVLANGAKNPTVTPGSTVTFKIEVWNQGNVDAQNIAVIDYIPNGLTLVADANWTAGTEVATLTTPIAALPAGDSTSVNISFTVDAGFNGSIRNFAEISDADNTAGLEDIDSTPDSNPGNDGTSKDDNISENHKANPNDDEDDHDYEDINVSPTPVFDLALRKVLANGAKNPTVSVGDTVTFRLDVFNQGNVDATNIEIDDTIPTGLTLADTSWTESGGIASLTTAIAALAAGDSTSVTITFTINAFASGTIRNVAKITGYENEFGLDDIDSDPTKEGTKDDEIDENGIEGEDEDSNDFEEINITPTLVFDLALKKTMTPGSKTIYKVGDVVTFDITIFNQGTVTATSVDLVDYIPTGLTLQMGSDWTLDGDKARWNGAITNLAPGAQETVQISFTVDPSATGVIVNTAEISGATNPQNLEDIDSTPDDDKDNDGPVKNDVINEDGKNGGDEDDHDIESITICLDAKCLTAKAVRKK